MLAKSLIIFIGVGLITGLVFGIYLIDVKNTSQLVFVDGASVSIVTEKFDFKTGEEINIKIVNSGTIPLTFSDGSYGLKITVLSGILMYSPVAAQVVSTLEPGEEIDIKIVNSGTTPLTFSDGSYGLKITGLSGILMYSPVAVQVVSTLEPGEEITFSWNQIKNDDNVALEGLYKISTNAMDLSGNKVEKSTTITIWK